MRRLFLLWLALINTGLADETKKIVIGTTVGDFGDMVKDSIQPFLKKKGYEVKLVEFSDYVRPNLALAEGSLNANCFQHEPYLKEFAQQHRLQLSPLTQVPTAPFGLYAGKTKALTAIKDGASVAVPNDPTNLARALVILQDLGWITLRMGIDLLTVSERDIATNPRRIKVVALEAAQLPRARADVDFAIINGNYAVSAGLSLKEALTSEKSFAYINWVVVNSKDLNTAWVKELRNAYQSDEFKQYARKRFVGYKFPQNW